MHQKPAVTTTTAHNPQIHPTFPSLRSPKSELASISSAPKSSPNVIEYGKDEGALENVLLGSDDYIFLLRELGNRGDRKKPFVALNFQSKGRGKGTNKVNSPKNLKIYGDEFDKRILEGFQVSPIWHQGFIRDDDKYPYSHHS
ncbi:unnamed protein product [Dovyalis caffra]|uniref:Uncharacterized protein n=1 Tax=Dovyalis caffra TaxID=77055 RepID=A0AAV1SGK6_9ROSI|nr:unnamed protein product [Dovyalis caffra]